MTKAGPIRAISGADVEVLIPNWNRREGLRRTLESLRSQTMPPAICVIDNGSSDGSAEMIQQGFPEVRLLPLSTNLGFGAAINRAASNSKADLIVLVNNDAIADPGFVEAMIAARTKSGAPMVAGCMLSPARTIESAGVVADQSLLAYDLLHGRRYDPSAEWLQGSEPLGPSGGAALYEREAFLEAGGFDEAMFAYLEDVEIAIRLRLGGASCVLAPAAFVVHEHSATLGSGSGAKNHLLARNRRYLLWKHGRSLGLRQRARGLALDAIVIAGRAALDHNLGAMRGWLGASREHPRRSRPSATPGFERVPLLELGFIEALRRRLDRRITWRA